MRSWISCILFLAAIPSMAQVNCLTSADQLGPYFIQNAPLVTNDTLAPGIKDTARGLQLTFFVSLDCDTLDLDTVSSSYIVELWHANAQGEYSNVDGNPNDFAYRGKLELTGKSTVIFTELPGIYPFRPSHIHIKSYFADPWFTDTLVTQLYFEGDSLLPFDIASTFPERWIPLDTTANGYIGSFSFGLALHIGANELAGRSWKCFPNPASNVLELKASGHDRFIQIADSRGSIYFEGDLPNGGVLDIMDWPRGSYIVRKEGTAQLVLVQ